MRLLFIRITQLAAALYVGFMVTIGIPLRYNTTKTSGIPTEFSSSSNKTGRTPTILLRTVSGTTVSASARQMISNLYGQYNLSTRRKFQEQYINTGDSLAITYSTLPVGKYAIAKLDIPENNNLSDLYYILPLVVICLIHLLFGNRLLSRLASKNSLLLFFLYICTSPIFGQSTDQPGYQINAARESTSAAQLQIFPDATPITLVFRDTSEVNQTNLLDAAFSIANSSSYAWDQFNSAELSPRRKRDSHYRGISKLQLQDTIMYLEYLLIVASPIDTQAFVKVRIPVDESRTAQTGFPLRKVAGKWLRDRSVFTIEEHYALAYTKVNVLQDLFSNSQRQINYDAELASRIFPDGVFSLTAYAQVLWEWFQQPGVYQTSIEKYTSPPFWLQ